MARHFASRVRADHRRRAGTEADIPATRSFERRSKDSGQRLDPRTRSALEPRLGHDFSEVRVHDDAAAAADAEALSASAFAVGSDIFFGHDRYEPESAAGLHLLAHELTHVAQADGHGNPTPGSTSTRGDASEAEARNAADHVLAGLHAPTISASPAAISLEGEGGHGHRGWMDRLFGLNPDKSFVESGMEGLGYGPTGIWGRPRGEDEGDLSMLGRGLGAAAMSPLAGIAAIGGHALDEINHGPLMLHGAFDS